MDRVSITEARRRWRTVLDIVEKGGEVTITKHGKDAGRLVPITPLEDGGDPTQMTTDTVLTVTEVD